MRMRGNMRRNIRRNEDGEKYKSGKLEKMEMCR